MNVAAKLQQGIQYIKAGEGLEAHKVFQEVVTHPDFEAAEDFEDIKARTFSLFAQSQYLIRDFPGAKLSIQQAVVFAKAIDDENGLKQLKNFSRQIEIEQMVSMRSHHSSAPTEPLIPIKDLLDLEDTKDTHQHLLKQATLYMTQGETVHLQPVLERLLGWQSIDTKTRVITLLMKARIQHQAPKPVLLQALAVADEANDFTLMQAVAKTAEQLGCIIGTLHGPKMSE